MSAKPPLSSPLPARASSPTSELALASALASPASAGSQPWMSRSVWLGIVLLSLLATAWSAAQVLTSTLAEYDDEGYVMISLESYLQGRPLYTQTYTQYGPAHYQLMKGLHALTAWPVNHNITRGKTWGVWLITAALSAAVVYRLTQQPWMALATYLAACCHLDKLCLEPGHPQETCLLGILVAVLAATWWQRGAKLPWLATTVMGIATGLVMMTKLNVGGLLLASITWSFLLGGSTHRLSRLSLGLAAFAFLVLPAVLCQQAWHQGWSVGLPVVVTAGIAAVCWWSDDSARKLAPSSRGGLLVFGLAVIVTCGASALLAIYEGTPPEDLVYGLVTQHLGFDRWFYHAAPVLWPAMVGAVALVRWLPLWRQDPAKTLPRISGAAVWIVGGLVVGFAWSTGRAAQSGLESRGLSSWLISFGPLLAWAIIPHAQLKALASPTARTTVDPGGESSHFGATVLALVSCLMPLMAYPTPGTQVELGTLCSLLAMMVLVSHRWQGSSLSSLLGASSAASVSESPATAEPFLAPASLTTSPSDQHGASRFPAISDTESTSHGPTMCRGAVLSRLQSCPAFCLALALLVVVVDRDVRWTWRRLSYEPLGLPGAEWLRLPVEQARQQQALVRALNGQSLATFVFAQHGQNRFYFWTGLRPPTGFNATFWPYMLTIEQQTATIRELQREQPSCVVALEQGDALYPRDRALPLRDFLQKHYAPAEQVGMWRVWRAVPTSPSAAVVGSAGPLSTSGPPTPLGKQPVPVPLFVPASEES